MAKHEAVDRLMALATERRADRMPVTSPGRPLSGEAAIPDSQPIAKVERVIVPTRATAGSDVSVLGPSPQSPGPTTMDRGRQLLQAVRPLLPAVAGAMRLVDHGAVQALARLLPLLGGVSGADASSKAAASAEQEHPLRELQAAHQAMRREVEALTLQAATAEDLLSRTRTQMERLASEQISRESEVRALADRVRLLSAGLVILLMLIVAQAILVVVVMHR